MDAERLAIAAECLRQIWQIHDAGGISVGRSRESVLLETAMELIPYDHRYSDLADTSPAQFEKARADARWAKMQETLAEHDREMGLDSAPV